MKKFLFLLVIIVATLTMISTAPAQAEEQPLIARIGLFALSPITGAVELVGTTVDNVVKKDGWNLPAAGGRGLINGISRVFGEGLNVFSPGVYDVEFGANNDLADNDIAANAVGWGAAGAIAGATGVFTPTISGSSPEFTAGAIGVALGTGVGAATQE